MAATFPVATVDCQSPHPRPSTTPDHQDKTSKKAHTSTNPRDQTSDAGGKKAGYQCAGLRLSFWSVPAMPIGADDFER
jgi:hypothetical protein